MVNLWRAVRRMIAGHCRHRSGFVVGEVEDAFIIGQTENELAELRNAEEPADRVAELADVFGCLIHYAVKHNITAGDIEDACLKKFEQRFEYPDGSKLELVKAFPKPC